jgi:pectin methylesterase-like acyl-CoA thioesterase
MKKLVPVCVCLLLAISTHAAVITVDDDGPAHYSSIQDAIDTAYDGDIIIVQPGFYEENINFLGKNITLTSTCTANPNITNQTIIQGDIVFLGTERAKLHISRI